MRKFELTRSFSMLSLLFVLGGGLLLGWLVREQEVGLMERMAENRNLAMTRLIEGLLQDDIARLLGRTTAAGRPGPAMLVGSERESLGERFRVLLHRADIVKIKVYDPRGLTLYSTDPAQIGVDQGGNPGFRSALAGEIVSQLVHRDRIDSFEGERNQLDLVSSYIPVSADGAVVAVFELYQDVTPLLANVNRSQYAVWASLAGVLTLLYLLQLGVVRRGQRRLNAQEAELEAVNCELDARVAARTGQLQQSEARLRAIMESARDAIVTVDAQGRVIGCNPAAEKMFACGRGQMSGRLAFDFLPERWQAAVRERFAALMEASEAALAAAGLGETARLTGRRADGSEFPLEHSMAIWETPDGRFLTSILRDITERKQKDDRIQELLQEQQVIFDNVHVGILLLKNRIVQKANQHMAEMFGYASAQELIGQSTAILYLSTEQFAAIGRDGYERLAREGAASFEIEMRRRDGASIWVLQTGCPLHQEAVLDGPSLWVYADVTERRLAEEKIRNLAYFDQLTGLPNRSLFNDRLRQAMLLSERSRRYGALIFIDLDHFKALNDTLGHDYGDLLLKQVAELLSNNVRQGDTVARLGGDEFVVILSGLDQSAELAAASVEAVCRKLLGLLKQDYRLAGNGFHCSASVGATLFLGRSAGSDELLKQADMAMYKSKECGRDAFSFFDPLMARSVLRRTQMEADLRRAILKEQFFLQYQPLVDGQSGAIVGAEALVRWQHPVNGLVPPGEFIGSAEENGLIVPLGNWVLEAACRQLARWKPLPHMAPLAVAVNVSVRQFRQADFVENVVAILERTGADPQRLKLELTESLFVDDVEGIIAKMQALKALGVGFSLDDFGTGYSSLANLSRLPLDQLKIDRSFVVDLGRSESNVVICAATITLAHSLDLKVVAEGVESEMQRYFLAVTQRCDLLQGYLFSRPLDAGDFEDFCVTHERARNRRA